MNDSNQPNGDETPDRPTADADLLARFVRQRDQQAFAELAVRHAALVLGVCRRVLRDRHDIEDAFQAVFLVLARDAGRIRKQKSLASWLYGVAYRTAIRAAAQRHRRRERELSAEPMTDTDPLAEVASRHEQQVVDDELNRLPPKLRAPLVLRYLVGQTNEEVASHLGVSISAVEGRLKRGKNELRVRLARRGVGLVAGMAAVGASQAAVDAACINSLTINLAEACVSYAAGSSSAAGHSPAAAQLAAKEQIAMLTMTPLAKAACAAGALCAVLAAVGFAGQGQGQSSGQSAGRSGRTIEVSGQTGSAPGGANAGAVRVDAGGAAPGGAFGEMSSGGGALGSYGSGMSSGGASTGRRSRGGGEMMMGMDYDGMMMEGGMMGSMGGMMGMGPAGRPTTFDLKEMSPAEQRIEGALADVTNFDFIDTPLSDVVQYLEEAHGIPIKLNARELDDIGIGSDTPITASLRGVSLRSALNIVLRELDLDYVVANEVLEITTSKAAENAATTHVYDVSSLENIATAEELAEIIQSSVRPDSWRSGDAETELDVRVGAVSAASGAIIVTNTQRTHQQIRELLTQLSRVKARPQSVRGN